MTLILSITTNFFFFLIHCSIITDSFYDTWVFFLNVLYRKIYITNMASYFNSSQLINAKLWDLWFFKLAYYLLLAAKLITISFVSISLKDSVKEKEQTSNNFMCICFDEYNWINNFNNVEKWNLWHILSFIIEHKELA